MLAAEARGGGGGGAGVGVTVTVRVRVRVVGCGGLGVLHFCRIINKFILFYHSQLIIIELKNTIFMQNFN